VFAIKENGFVLLDLFCDSIQHCIDGWIGENGELHKRQTNGRGIIIIISLILHCLKFCVMLINVIDFSWNEQSVDKVVIK
jgi:hypothetical protein